MKKYLLLLLLLFSKHLLKAYYALGSGFPNMNEDKNVIVIVFMEL